MWETEYKDKIILALKQKYRQKQSENQDISENVWIGVNNVPLHWELLFDGKCSMMLPDTLVEMPWKRVIVRYRSQNRPQIIKAEINGDAAVTFSLLDAEDGENISDQLLKIRRDMQKLWKQNVFYDVGKLSAQESEVAWMDLKAFCLNGSIYSLIFLWEIKEGLVLGNFHCSFPRYDIWKPIILKLLTTIRIGGEHERLFD